ncbi:hypothetical protein AbraIFM66951_001108 [Aspergillus brasiliensis]|uniref:Uncharacterized protein n=1 Tax=Aspergillus brasiliensis TaxID=319629 RepID=A0A9W5YYW2_9EURO|nr:hypothetical protein AbraCBS73388_000644 [Aspergillus brasiliensis]GKZ48865.1 hypothetical protein AbraIFM66951_001108 [Aspergillus brasiliensis]
MAPNRPEILLLCLVDSALIEDLYGTLLERIEERAKLKCATTIEKAVRYLQQKPKAVIVADEGVTIPANRLVTEELEAYMRNGGLAIFGLCFPAFVDKNRFTNVFRARIGLPWVPGEVQQSTFKVNPECTLPDGTVVTSLPTPYKMQALLIKNARPKEKIYVPVELAMTESPVGSAPKLIDQTLAAVLGAKVGDGYLAYCGDIDPNENLNQLILSLCGCLW